MLKLYNVRNYIKVNSGLRTISKSATVFYSKADPSSFCGSRTGNFFQAKPVLKNQYTSDPLLSEYLKTVMPSEVYESIKDDLHNFGHSVTNEILKHHENVCNSEPILKQYDAWGNRVDDIIIHPSWKVLHDVSASEGLISIPYENKYAEWSRLYQTVKLYLFSQSSALYSCPLAMTDGASSILQNCTKEPFLSAFKNLTSTDPNRFWTSGQWMTEKLGGSDVGNSTETLAIQQSDGTFKLYGYKWFTSACDANISLTLARVVDKNGSTIEGSKGLTMFYLETRTFDGRLNGIRIEKLKKKLGTRQMPTAEMILDGTIAHQISDIGRGIAAISHMLTITRIHNSISAISNMRRMLNLSIDFSTKRKAFGETLCNLPLHVQTLSRLEVEQRGAFLLLMKVACLFGLEENSEANDQQKLLLRILTPLLKLYTAKQAINVASEGLESFGGHGYLEDAGLPTLLRDGQVLSIWEGTTNVLSLDVLRSVIKTDGEVLKVLFQESYKILSIQPNGNQDLQKTNKTLKEALNSIEHFTKLATMNKDESYLTSAARDYAYSLARTFIGCLLYENAAGNSGNLCSSQVAFRWCHLQDLVPVKRGGELGLYELSSHELEKQIMYQ